HTFPSIIIDADLILVDRNRESMTRRYKGRPSGKTIALDFPFVVEIAVPPNGLGRRLMRCMRSTISAAYRWRASNTGMKTDAISCCGVLPAVQSRNSLPLNSAAP